MSAGIDRLQRAFRRAFGEQPVLFAEAPGRVNLIGEHTDYNEGFVLPVAIDRTVAAAALRRDDRTVRARALDYGEADDFVLGQARRAKGDTWRNYVRGVAWAAIEEWQRPHGADIAISGDVPRGAGLSSSAALELAVAGALLGAEPSQLDAVQLALLCQKAENGFAGVQCGIMDQLSSAAGVEGHALLIDCRSLEWEPIPLPEVAIVVVDSKVPRRLAATAYNDRREECKRAAAMLAVPALRNADGPMLAARATQMPEVLYRRARHVVTENARVQDAASALRSSDLAALGCLMKESHESLRDDFEVSCRELDLLVELAQGADGTVGSRLTGAGFGGCTVNLVVPDAIDTFRATVIDEYRARTGLAAEMHVCKAVDGLKVYVA